MKKIILSLAALAALSTASFAQRSYDLRDLQTLNGHSSNGTNLPITLDSSSSEVFAFAVPDVKGDRMTAYERQLMNAYINEHGGR